MSNTQKLIQAAAATARAHRDAMRLLAEGIGDAAESDHEALLALLGDPSNFDSMTEVRLYTQLAFQWYINMDPALCDAVHSKGGMSRQYKSILDEVEERVSSTCPCRGCVLVREQATKIVNASVQKARRSVIRDG